MVREWGMSERVGPMAWGQEGAVFLGEDLMHSRDYSDVTSRVIDEEVERILREQEARACACCSEHRQGLAAVARALLEKETIDGDEVGRLVDEAYGRPVHDDLRSCPPSPSPSPTGTRPRGHAEARGPATLPLPSTNWQHREPR